MARDAEDVAEVLGLDPARAVELLQDHAERGVTSIYDRHSYDREKREALDGWGERLREVVFPIASGATSAGA
jgi:hypothetical protein